MIWREGVSNGYIYDGIDWRVRKYLKLIKGLLKEKISKSIVSGKVITFYQNDF